MKALRLAACLVVVMLFSSISSIAQLLPVKYGDGQADGKKSLGGSGEMIQFTLPAGHAKIDGIRIHGSRYGSADAPRESFLIYVLNQDLSEVINTEMAPYSLFERGDEKWVEVKFRKPIAVPQQFWIALDFRAGRTKGVYVSYDSSTDGTQSRIGLPGMEAKQPDFAGDWMIEVLPAN